jgi:glycosyltransferase involved in cell wall biosynthesis
MRVLLVLDTIGGVWTYGLELTRALARHGIEVVLAALGNPLSPEQRRDALESPAARVYAFQCALEWMEHPWGDVARSGDWLLEVAGETGVDLVHLNAFAHGALPWPVPVLIGAHSDVLSWHEAVRGEPAGPQWDAYREAAGAGLLGADAVVAPTEAMLRDLEGNYRFICARRAIPNARDPERFAPLAKEPFIFSAGRLWDEAKNIAALDRIAPRLDWPVVLAGPGEPGACRRLGSVSGPQLARLFGRAAIFAEPARYEPFGLAALEAGLAGCALLLGDIDSLREVWADAAVFVNEDSLERELRRLIADPGLCRDLGARARRRALEYPPERMGEEYAGLYEQLLSEDPADLHAIEQVA